MKYSLVLFLLISHGVIGQSKINIAEDSLKAVRFFQKGDSLMKSRKLREAAEQFQEAELIYYKLRKPKYITCIAKTIECSFRLGNVSEIARIAPKILSSDSLKHLVSREMISFYMAMGPAEYIKGDLESAIRYSEKALKMNNTLDAHFGMNLTNNLGIFYGKTGDPHKAIDYFQKGIELNQQTIPSDAFALSTLYINVANLYMELDELEEAEKFQNMSIGLITQSVGENSEIMGRALTDMGNLAMLKEEYDDAIELHSKALNIFSSIYGDKHFLVSRTFNNMGRVHHGQKNYDLAILNYKKALKIRTDLFGKKHQDISLIWLNIANSHYEHQDYENALSAYQNSLIANVPYFEDSSADTNPTIGLFLNKLSFLNMLNGKARTLLRKFERSNDPSELLTALKTVQSGDTLVQTLRSIHLDQNDKIALGKKTSALYALAVDISQLLWSTTRESSYKKTSFYFAERSKAGVLSEAISDQWAKKLTTIPAEIISKEKDIKVFQNFYRTKIQNALVNKVGYDTSQLTLWKDKLFQLDRQLDSLTLLLQSNYPEYHNLKYSNKDITVEEIQNRLSMDEAFLEYFVGDTASYIYSITKSSFDIISIGHESELANEVRDFRQSLKSGLGSSTGPVEFTKRSRRIYLNYLAPAMEKFPNRISKLIIIGDAGLSYVPFDILLTEDVKDEIDSYQNLPYLLNDYEISYAFSAKLLFNQFSNNSKSEEGTFVAFAPQYQSELDSIRNYKYGRFRDQITGLKWNTEEIQRINDYMKGTIYTGPEAVEDAFKSTVGSHDIVHLAMHALVDDEDPMNSKLIFSQVNDSIEDNFLHAYELYNMQVPAQMVVLSACETGFGKLEKGEGVMSLARAFAYAGCPSVVMSHWSVNDESTAEVMIKFYEYINEGYSKGEALRQAKLDFIAQASPAQANPLFWGSFVIMGNNESITSKGLDPWMYLIIGTTVLIGILVIRKRYFMNVSS